MSKQRPSRKRRPHTGRPPSTTSGGGGPEGREAAAKPHPLGKHIPSSGALRELIESVVVAFVLAFLFRTFEAEAFVIPTGSMAPTLMGRHKDLTCPKCGYPFQVSASEEVKQDTNTLEDHTHQIVGCICPMCRYPIDLLSEMDGELDDAVADLLVEDLALAPQPAAELARRFTTMPASDIQTILDNELGIPSNVADTVAGNIRNTVRHDLWEKYPSYNGDHILVGKFCYQFDEPERWDVAVFKYPGGAKTNYIKRLVGLPGETIRIRHGDIFVKQRQQDFTIARKDRPEKLLAVLQPVYDNDYVVPELLELGWPARWQAWPSADGTNRGIWTTDDWLSFQTDGTAAGETWLRYQHFVPSPQQWQSLAEGRLPPNARPTRQLISDFSAYNSRWTFKNRDPDSDYAGLHWVGDLAVQCTLEALSDSGETILELVEGGWRMQCRIDVATGRATLSIHHDDPRREPAHTLDGREYRPTAQTPLCQPGEHVILFANCDDQLWLWVDGTPVEFDTQTAYLPLGNTCPEETYLFSIDTQYRFDLQRGVVSPQLRLQLKNQGIFLSDRASISTRTLGTRESPGTTWLLSDQTDAYVREFIIRSRGNALEVFDPADLAPVGIATAGAALRVSHVKVLRDIYYIAVKPLPSPDNEPLSDFPEPDFPRSKPPPHLLCDPDLWDAFHHRGQVSFTLEENQFLALGDNSAKSKDGRLWEQDGHESYVKRRLLIGKAIYVYWPHSWNKVPGTDIPLPMFPNFERMGFVR